MEKLDAEYNRYVELKDKLDDDLAEEIITKEEYDELYARFKAKRESILQAKKELKEHIGKLNLNDIYKQSWLNDIKEYGNIVELNRKLVIVLIEKIVVYDKNSIEIYFRYGDEMEFLISTAEAYERQGKGELAV